MIVRKISQAVLEQKPYEAWNAFVNLLATEDCQDLNEVQQIAYLCFWYDSEVQNGGHLQYFENGKAVLLSETLEALLVLGANCQHAVLKTAAGRYRGERREQIETLEDYVNAGLRSDFAMSDSAYHECKPTMQELLAHYLERNKSHFIEIT